MRKESKDRLIKKGWSKEDIAKAENVADSRVMHDKSRSTTHTHRVLFWCVLFVMIIGNALVALVLIPMILVLTPVTMTLFSLGFGFFVGLIFNFLVWDVEEHITRKHHVLAATIIPLLAVIDLYAIVKISNAINDVFQITAERGDPITIGAFYVIAFLTPYLWTLFVKKKIKRY